MEPLVNVLAAYPVHRLLEVVEHAVRHHVVERWSKRRANEFFATFCASFTAGDLSEEQLSKSLDALLSDETNSETMFDAYRSVALTKSRVTGPRVIALLTARLVAARTAATDEQDLLFAAAELLSDHEFKLLVAFVRDHERDVRVHRFGEIETRDMKVQIRHESHDSNWPSESVSMGPLDIANDVGTWASKLKQIGLISDELRERHKAYEEDGEANIDIPGVTRRLTWWLTLSSEALELADLAEKAMPLSAS